VTAGLRRRIFVLGLVLAAFSWFASFALHSERPHYFDFDLHYYGAQVERDSTYTDTDAVRTKLLEQRGIAHPEGVIGTPALVALVYVPLSFLARFPAEIIWNIMAIAAIAFALSKALPRQWWCFVPYAFCTAPLVLSMWIGNASSLTFALIALTYGFLRNDNDRAAGTALGLAMAFKLFPGFLLLPLLTRRRLPALATAALTFVTTTVAAICILGWHDFSLGMQRTLEFESLQEAYVDNIGLPGTLRWLGAGQTVATIAQIALLTVGAVAVLMKRRMSTSDMFATLTIVMVLGQSLSWNHYFSMTILGLIAISHRWAVLNISQRTGLLVAVVTMIPGLNAHLLTIGALCVLGVLLSLRETPTSSTDPADHA
jgi:hypothetical protein